MTTALAVIQPEELDTIRHTAKLLAASGYFEVRGESPQAIAQMATKIMAGREMGFGPFASVNGIHMIQNKPSTGANLMAAAVKGSGRYDYRVREMTDKICKIEFFQRAGDKWESLGISDFTAEDARKAGTKNTDKFPRNMLFARALSNGVRWYTPDVFSGNAVYVPEELGADVDGNGDVIEGSWSAGGSQPAPQTVTMPVGETASQTPPAMTLSELTAKYSPAKILEACGGILPGTSEEIALVAAKLAERETDITGVVNE